MHTWGQVHWYMWPGTLVHGAKYTGTGGQVHWYMGPSTLVHGPSTLVLGHMSVIVMSI